ncbi:hypothetical protein [Cupriavidus basilensis]
MTDADEEEEDLVRARVDQALHVACAGVHQAAGLIGVEHHHGRIGEIRHDRLRGETGLDHGLARRIRGEAIAGIPCAGLGRSPPKFRRAIDAMKQR